MNDKTIAPTPGLEDAVRQLIEQNQQMLARLERIEAQLKASAVDKRPEVVRPTDARPVLVETGDPAPAFALKNLADELMQVPGELRGKQSLLMFWQPGCGHCLQLAPELASLAKARKSSLNVMLVSNGTPDRNREVVDKFGFTFPLVIQQDGWEIGNIYGVSGTPTAFVLDAAGAVTLGPVIGGPDIQTLLTRLRSNGEVHEDPTGIEKRPVGESKILRTGLPPGTPAPVFKRRDIDGRPFDLAMFRGTPSVVIFSDASCGPCNELAPKLAALEHRAEGRLQMVMVVRGTPEANQRKRAEHGFHFPMVRQDNWEISRAYGFFATPIAFLLDGQGIIAQPVAAGVTPIVTLIEAALDNGVLVRDSTYAPVTGAWLRVMADGSGVVGVGTALKGPFHAFNADATAMWKAGGPWNETTLTERLTGRGLDPASAASMSRSFLSELVGAGLIASNGA